MTNLRNLSLFGVLFGFVVVALGAWTRLVDAGLGCPDWPGCYGFVVFPTSELDVAIAEERFPQFPYDINKAIPEVVHRYFIRICEKVVYYTPHAVLDRQKIC